MNNQPQPKGTTTKARFTGKQYRGAQRDSRSIRKEEAEARNAATLPENRKANRVTKNA